MNILDPLTGECRVIDITQRLANRKATIRSLAAPVGYTAELVDLSGALARERAMDRSCRLTQERIDKAIEDIRYIVDAVRAGEMKPCDSE